MRLAIIDAQGAGLGQSIIKKIRKELNKEVFIIGLGTNSVATSNLVRSGANVGITGESAICTFCNKQKIDALIGPIGIMVSGGINGEITPNISSAIFNMACKKYIIPLQNHGIYIPGTRHLTIKDIIDEIVRDLNNL